MLKKISAVLFIVIFAFIAFLYVQKGKIEQKFTALLAENAVKTSKIEFRLFPPVMVELNDVHYVFAENKRLVAQSLRAELNLWYLLQGEMNLQSFHLTQGQVFYTDSTIPDLTELQVDLRPDFPLSLQDLSVWLKSFHSNHVTLPRVNIDLSAETAQNDQIKLKSQFAVALNKIQFAALDSQLVLSNKRLFNQNKLALQAEQGFLIFSPNHYIATFVHPVFNQIKLDEIQAEVDAQTDLSVSVQVSQQAQNTALSLNLNQQQDSYVWTVTGTQLPLESWLTAFNIAELVSGNANVEMRLFSDEIMPKQGDVEIDVTDGKVKGLNVLQLISQYTPINFDETAKNMDTNFDVAQAKFHWQPTVIQVDEAKLQHRYFILQSQGVVDLTQNRCDFRANIAVNDQRYQALALPVRFFGSCQSPEYKVEINRSFRDQLKNFIKEKLK